MGPGDSMIATLGTDHRASGDSSSPRVFAPRRAVPATPDDLGQAAKLILVVEDESDLAETLCYNLQREGHRCDCVSSGSSALERLRVQPPDLIILDRMLPGLSGEEVLKRIKSDPTTARIPVVMLTAKAEESDQLVGFALGADDYITKPFSLKVLLARVAAVIRRNQTPTESADVMVCGPVQLDTARHEVTVEGVSVHLTATQFRLLKTLMGAQGRVLSRTNLIDAAFGTNVAITDRTIDVHLTSVRRKLGEAAGWVQTVRGVGYTLRPPE